MLKKSSNSPSCLVQLFRRFPRLTLLTLPVVVIVGLDLLAGTIVHALGFDPAAAGSNTSYRMRHPVYHHGLIPSVEKIALWGGKRHQIVTDQLGLKSAKGGETPLTSKKQRLLVIGDSFTEGLGYNFDDTYVGLVNEGLGDEVEVLNAGVVSYSPTIYNRKIRYLIGTAGLEVDGVIVMIDMSDIADEGRDYSLGPGGEITHRKDGKFDVGFKRFVDRHTLLFKSARTVARILRHKRAKVTDQGSEGSLDQARCLWGSDDGLWESYGKIGLERATTQMDELRQFLADRDIPLRVGVYPWPDQIVQRDLEALQVRHWRAWTEAHGVSFTNCFPAFIGEEPAEEVIGRYFTLGDVHWNAAGHQRIAECLLRDL